MSILQNTTALQNEQTELQSLLESVNALPEAGVSGEVITVYSSSTAPDDYIGNDGDIYLVVSST